MGDAETNTPTLDDLMTVNEELTALVDAGVPLELELAGHETDLATMYAKFSATLGRRISHGLTLEGALGKNGDEIPRTYRSLMLLGLRFDQLNLALDSSRALATTADESRFIVRAGLDLSVHRCLLGLPGHGRLFVVAGADAGQHLRRSRHEARPVGCVLLDSLRASLPYWVAIPPALLAIAVVWRGWRRGVRDRPRRRTARPVALDQSFALCTVRRDLRRTAPVGRVEVRGD